MKRSKNEENKTNKKIFSKIIKLFFQLLFLPLRIWYYLFIKMLALKKVRFIEVEFKGKMNESPPTSGIMSLLKPPGNQFYLKILELIVLDNLLSYKQSKLKKELKEILVVVHNPKLGWSKAWELNQLLESLNKKVKVSVFLDSADTPDYYAALGAGEIYTSPAMSLQLTGLESTSLFFSGLLSKLNVKANFIQIGNYKSAGEKYTRKNFSDFSKKQLQELLNDFESEISTALKKSRGKRLKKPGLSQIQKKALINSQEAFEYGLLDGVLYLNELKLLLEKRNKIKNTKFFPIEKAISKTRKKQKKLFSTVARKKIAFLVGEGLILDSEDTNPKAISYSDYRNSLVELQKAKHDAYVLRWNSPGGSALVSDLLWFELMKLNQDKSLSDDSWRRLSKKYAGVLKKEENSSKRKKKQKKTSREPSPIFVSQSDVAASGGYYLSAVSKNVYSTPMSITGSIGVIIGKFNVSGILKKVGVNVDRVKVGEQSDIFSGFSNFSPQQVKLIKKNMNSMYDLFADRINQGRAMPVETIKKLGGGRVYSGKNAQKLGLVDHLGGLREVFSGLRRQLNLNEEDEIIVDFYPKIKAPLFPKPNQSSPLMQEMKTVEFFLQENILFLFPL